MRAAQQEVLAGQSGHRGEADEGVAKMKATPPLALVALPVLPYHRADAASVLPPQLTDAKAKPRWIAWGDGKGPGANGKLNKKPHAKSNQEENWLTYEAALAEARRLGASGVGYQIRGSTKVVALDFDHVVQSRNPDTGEVKLSERGARLVAALGPDVYAEVSPSQTGLRVIAQRPGQLDLTGPTNHKFEDTGEGVEVYTGTATQYLTITGDVLPGREGKLGVLPMSAIAAIEAEGVVLKWRDAATAPTKAPESQRDGRWREKVVNLLDAPDLLLLDEGTHDADHYASRSEHVAGLIARLASAGLDAERIYSIVISAEGTWGYATDKRGGDEKRALAFLWNEVQKAAGWVEKQQDAVDAGLSDWLEHIVFIEDGSAVADLRRPGTARVTKWKDFERANANQYVYVQSKGGTRKVPKVKLWLPHEGRKTARGTVWDPGGGSLVEKVVMQADGSDERVLFVNTYQRKHHHVELADPALLDVFREQVAYMYGEDARLLEEFYAHRVQFPGERPPIAMLSIAKEQGTGRGWLNVVLGGVLGEWNVKKVAPKDFAGDYDDHKVECVHMFVEEIANKAAKKWEMDADLRDAITAHHGEVNRKYGKKGQESFFASIGLETNHRDAVKLTEDDRRLMVLEVTSPLRPNEHYARLYTLVLGERRDAFFASVYHHLAHLDLSGFRAMNRAPMNRAKKSLIAATNTDIEKAIVEIIETCPAKAIMPASVVEWLDARGIEVWGHEAEIRAVLRARAFKPYDERTHRVRDPSDATKETSAGRLVEKPERERRKVAPWILRQRDRELSFVDLQEEVRKAHRWVAEARERDLKEDEGEPLPVLD